MGKFIVIEGPDGTGKSTVINGLKETLPKELKVKYFREPGGSYFGEKIRKILLDNDTVIEPETEALLFAAMRCENYSMLKKDLPKYDLIIADRFLPSSIAYQGGGLALGMERVEDLNDFCLHGYRPDLTIYLMLDFREGLKRIESERGFDRLEMRNESFHRAVFRGYEKLSKAKNSKVVSADMTKEKVLEEVRQYILDLIKEEEA